MADPIIPTGIRAQVTFEAETGIPEDRWVTTWAFERDDAATASEADAAEVASRLTEFFTGPLASGDTLLTYLGRQASGRDATIRCYLLGQTPPRTPIEFTFPVGSTTADSWPSELAVCLSFYSLTNQPRNRGRIYFGPLQAEAGAYLDGEVRVSPAARGHFAEAAARLAANDPPISWGVLSQADASIKTITHGWVDNAFDVQRRRGVDATARTTWTA